MSRRVVVVALLTLVSLAGCDASTDGPDAPTSAESLWSSRVSYVGDNSRVMALVDEVGAAPEGSYTLALATAQPPYGLTIDLERLDNPFDDTDFSGPATLLLGLVENLDKVSVTADGHAYSLTAAGASEDLGYDVKSLGQDQSRLSDYLDAHSD